MKICKHKYWNRVYLLFMLLMCCSLVQAQNALVLNGGITVLNGGTAGTQVYLVVNEASTTGITRLAGGGHIHSENQYNFVKWESGTGTGNYVFPFGVAGNAADYIPFTFNKTTAGSSDIDMSTWQTNVQNVPHAAATNVGPVTSMTGTADSVVSALDRFWDIQTSAAVTADLTFSYLGAVENTTASPTDTVKAQHWNGTSWDVQAGPGNLGVIAGIGTVGPIPNQTTFSPWILSVIPTCPTATISYLNASACDNDTTTQNAVLTGGAGGVYTASPIGLTINPTTGAITPNTSTAGAYTITYTITDATGICPVFTTTANFTITAAPTVVANATSISVCVGDTVTLSGAGATTYTWDNGVTDGVTFSPTITATYIVIGTANGCQNADTITVTVNSLPIIVASPDDTICPGAISNVSATGGINYTWDNGLGVGQNQAVSPAITTTYIVTGSDANCSSTDTVIVTVEPGTIADAGIDQILCDDILTVTLNGNTPLLVGETGLWSTATGGGIVTIPTLQSATGTGLSLGTNIFVWTIANIANNCPATSDSVIITVEDCEPSSLIIPNVFTPNGDGSNDAFTVDGVNLASVEGEIFNRWGQKMFSWDNVNGHWDGRTNAGSEVPDGTYFYIIRAIGADGTEYFQKGTVSLIR